MLVDRQAISLHALAFAALAILAVQPEAVTEPGFQMSFAATAALVALAESWTPPAREIDVPWPIRAVQALAAWIAVSIAASLVAGLATGPFALQHFNRVSTMGELAASLAHELRQPLSGILTNAQAALRFLQSGSSQVDEIRGAMQDIVEDDRRAAAVIQRLRDLLTKREPSRTILDLNAVIRSVAGLLGSDAVIRRVQVSLDLAPEAIPVCGDRIQLEQVVLNLMVNGLEAMTDCLDRERVLLVRTEREDSRAEIAVVDAGAGLPQGAEERVFEPFFTTKPAGMGMGLSIARSIVESHGGTIRATSNAGHGATFVLVLPCGG